MKWEQIELAPHDGTIVVVKGFYDGNERVRMKAVAAMYRDGAWFRDNHGYGYTVVCNPTHFVPYPFDS